MKKISGIYCFTHIKTGRRYVGSSVNVHSRRTTHFSEARRGSLSCFHKAIRKYGVDAFSFTILEECEQDDLLDREEYYIGFFNAASLQGFNSNKNPKATYGRISNEASVQRMAESQRIRMADPEERKKLKERQKRRCSNPAVREEMRLRQIKKWQDPEYRAAMIAKHKARCADAKQMARVKSGYKKFRKDLAAVKKAVAKRSETTQTPEFRKRVSDQTKKRWKNLKLRERQMEVRTSEAYRNKMRDKAKAAHAAMSPEQKKELGGKIKAGRAAKKLERILHDLSYA